MVHGNVNQVYSIVTHDILWFHDVLSKFNMSVHVFPLFKRHFSVSLRFDSPPRVSPTGETAHPAASSKDISEALMTCDLRLWEHHGNIVEYNCWLCG